MCDLDSVIIPYVQCGSRVNPLPTNDTDMCRETFSFMIYPAMSLGDGFYVNRNGGTGGGGWVQPNGANSMTVYRFGCETCMAGAWLGHYINFPFLKHRWT